MVKILIVTHGPLAHGFIDTAKLIVGNISNVSSIVFNDGDDPEKLLKAIETNVENTLSNDNELLIFADLFGGSPSNRIAMYLNSMKDRNKVEAISGINLPMLLDALILADTEDDVKKVKESCMASGLDGVKDLKEVLEL